MWKTSFLYLDGVIIFLWLVFCMANTGEVFDCVNTTEGVWEEVLNGSAEVHDRSSYMSPVVIANMQRQIRENNALLQSLRKELRRSSSVASSLGPSSPSGFFTREPSEARLTLETSRVPEDGVSLFVSELSIMDCNIRCPFRYQRPAAGGNI